MIGGTNIPTKTTPHGGTKDPSYGVYIQDTDGYYHTALEWDGSYVPNGIAVIASDCRFVIALDEESTLQWSTSNSNTVSNVMMTTVRTTAITDYQGDANTTEIINQLGVGNAPSAEYCRKYTFPNGSTGYMGAAGEWNVALINNSAIDEALIKCGGVAMSTGSYSATTQVDKTRNWVVPWTSTTIGVGSKINYRPIRAFCSI